MPDQTPQDASSPGRREGRGVLCAKCEHLNPLGIDACEYCEHPLYVDCPGCAAVNPRVLARCRECRTPLHKGEKGGRSGRGGREKPRPEESAAAVVPGSRGVLCAKCEHLNHVGIDRCEQCGAHLLIKCPACSVPNVRALARCSECGAGLHRSIRDRILGAADSAAAGKFREPARVAEPGRGVLCAKCDHLNPGGIDRCENCHGHLYVACRDCGHTNARVLPRCEKCGRRLHRSMKERMRGGERRPFNLAYAAAGGVAILVAAYIFVKMSGLRLLE